VLVLHRLALDEPPHHPLCPRTTNGHQYLQQPCSSTTNASRPI
jgi:hypothetical protein